jgi:hypothetical protein
MMARRKRTTKRPTASDEGSWPAASRELDVLLGSQDQIATSNLSLHELFQQQARDMLDRADLDEEQKQSILIAMSCPCCGAGGLSFTAKLKRRT